MIIWLAQFDWCRPINVVSVRQVAWWPKNTDVLHCLVVSINQYSLCDLVSAAFIDKMATRRSNAERWQMGGKKGGGINTVRSLLGHTIRLGYPCLDLETARLQSVQRDSGVRGMLRDKDDSTQMCSLFIYTSVSLVVS